MTTETTRLKGRDLKKMVQGLLREKDFCSVLDEIVKFPGKQVINPLFSFILDVDELVRWRAIALFGFVVSKMAQNDVEGARVIMRRLMWSLNDESGGIGWGAPEAMSEVMAQSHKMAQEYHAILISYLDENGNFLEYEVLQKGLIWGVARVSNVYPDLFQPAVMFLPRYLFSPDPSIRGLSAFALGALRAASAKELLEKLLKDDTEFRTFLNGELKNIRVLDLVNQAISMLV